MIPGPALHSFVPNTVMYTSTQPLTNTVGPYLAGLVPSGVPIIVPNCLKKFW